MTVSPTVTERSLKKHSLTDVDSYPPFLFLIALFLVILLTTNGWAETNPSDRTPEPEAVPVLDEEWEPANRESLLLAIDRYAKEITSLKDSLGTDHIDFHLDDRHRERLEGSISEFTGLIEDIGQELSRMDFEISGNRVSLTDEFGEGIIINIPENLDERLSEGMQALTQMILQDLPDSNAFGIGRALDISTLFQKPRHAERKIIQGNIVKVSDDVHITPIEDLRGNLVVVMGDAVVSGRVDGDVVVVLGNLLLDKDCEVTGKVVCVLGRLDREPSAEVGDLVAIDPWSAGDLWGSWDNWDGLNEGLMAFLISQSLFLVVLMIAILMIGVTPDDRLHRVLATLRSAPAQTLGIGIVAGFGLHILSVILMAVLVLTVVGLPLALLLGIGLGLVAALAITLAAVVTGETLCGLVSRKCNSLWLAVVVGLVALHAVSFAGGVLGVFHVAGAFSTFLLIMGWGIKTLAYFLGIGGLARSQVWRKNLS